MYVRWTSKGCTESDIHSRNVDEGDNSAITVVINELCLESATIFLLAKFMLIIQFDDMVTVKSLIELENF